MNAPSQQKPALFAQTYQEKQNFKESTHATEKKLQGLMVPIINEGSSKLYSIYRGDLKILCIANIAQGCQLRCLQCSRCEHHFFGRTTSIHE